MRRMKEQLHRGKVRYIGTEEKWEIAPECPSPERITGDRPKKKCSTGRRNYEGLGGSCRSEPTIQMGG